MAKKIFISYSHIQKDWVRQRLVPCLQAGGAEVLIDDDKLRIGPPVVGQLDALQDQADASLLVFTPEYLGSPYCCHEMDRAVARDAFLPVKLADCSLPAPIPDHLYADLRHDSDPKPWDKLLDACEASLGCDAPHWLSVRDDILRDLLRQDSVNLVVSGHPKWRELITHLQQQLPQLRQINLDDGETAGRPGLIGQILQVHGDTRPVPAVPDDIRLLSQFLKQRKGTMIGFLRFDNVVHRPYLTDFFNNLRFHLEQRNLSMLIESSAPFASLLPAGHPLSSLASIKHVELRGR